MSGLDTKLTDLANAIRTKTGVTGPLSLDDMVVAIENYKNQQKQLEKKDKAKTATQQKKIATEKKTTKTTKNKEPKNSKTTKQAKGNTTKQKPATNKNSSPAKTKTASKTVSKTNKK